MSAPTLIVNVSITPDERGRYPFEVRTPDEVLSFGWASTYQEAENYVRLIADVEARILERKRAR